jgi:hypothetical protein
MIAFQLESDGRHSATRMRAVAGKKLLMIGSAHQRAKESSAMTIDDFYYSRDVPPSRQTFSSGTRPGTRPEMPKIRAEKAIAYA